MGISKEANISVLKYRSEYRRDWDDFVSNSKNGVFLFYRDYMDYHSDRFQDHSLLFMKGGKLIGLLPANIDGDTLYSHAGLTFGGVVSSYEMRTTVMLDIFDNLITYCKKVGITNIVYKAIPRIYHSAPADEDLYALFRKGAKLIGRNLSSTIYIKNMRKFAKKRREAISKAKRTGLVVKRSFDFDTFFEILNSVLKARHQKNPVHSVIEMKLLANRFPNNIKLFVSSLNEKFLAGCLIYESQNVAHGQYAANSDEGLKFGAQDIIIDYLINDYYKDKRFFDFGISTETWGKILNEGLIAHKSSFGASAVVYDLHQLTI